LVGSFIGFQRRGRWWPRVTRTDLTASLPCTSRMDAIRQQKHPTKVGTLPPVRMTLPPVRLSGVPVACSRRRPRGSLPGQLTRYIWRRSTTELVGRRLAEHRLVGLVGPGGRGQTRIAIEVGREAQSSRHAMHSSWNYRACPARARCPAPPLEHWGWGGTRCGPAREPVRELALTIRF
jgi:hypothetical protein